MSLKTRFSLVFKPALDVLQRLPPRWQRVIGVGVPAALVLLLVALVVPSQKGGLGTATGTGYVGQVLVNGNEADNTIDSLTAAVGKILRESAERDRAIQDLRDQLRAAKQGGEPPALPASGASVRDGRPDQPTLPTVARASPTAGAPPAAKVESPQGAAGSAVQPPPGSAIRTDIGFSSFPPLGIPAGASIAPALAPEVVWGAPARRALPEPGRPVSGGAGPAPAVVGAARLHVYAAPVVPAVALPPAKPASEVFELAPGGTFGGVLLTGFDAPTAQQARRDPVPALLRIKHNTILPNHYDADQRECFVLLSGYGDLSAERAYLRTEELSCVLGDGSTFHERIEGYAVDETGRLGVRGPVVSKQGAFIARSLVVGIMQGVAQAFAGSNQAYGIGINGSGQLGLQQYQNMTQSGVIEGAGKGLDRVAEFYLSQAAAMFPVIEINAGRAVDVVLTKAVKVRLPSGS